MSYKAPEFLTDLEEHLIWFAREMTNLSDEALVGYSRVVIDAIRGEWGGLVIYVTQAKADSRQPTLAGINSGAAIGQQNDKAQCFLARLNGAIVAALDGLVGPAVGADTAAATVEHFVARWGGLSLYIPRGGIGDNQSRDEEIYTKFSGINTFALAQEYNLSMQQIYNIIRRQRQERIDRDQLSLPGIHGKQL